MAEDHNEITPIETAAPVPQAPEATEEKRAQAPATAPLNEASDEAAAKAPRTRRTRKPKAEAADAASAPAADGEEVPRRTRARRTAAKSADAGEHEVSPEVAQARALAQVSQAQVARKQRRAAEDALELLEAAASAAETTSEPAAAEAPKRTRTRKKREASETAAASAALPEGMTPELLAALPKVDPALRPHRRGRKPKAYVEAERAAAAAAAALLAQQQAAAAPAEGTTSEPAAAQRAGGGAVEAADEASAAQDVRPGRGCRAKDKQAEASEETARAPEKDAVEAPAEASDQERIKQTEGKAAEGEKRERRGHTQRHEQDHGERDGRKNRDERGDRSDRKDRDRRNNRNDRNDRNDRRNNKRNNRYNAPTEPSLSRDELSGMKVAELREKARSLDIDPTGKKKAELVEEVYTVAARAEGFRDIEGILDITNEGFGYIRAHGYMPSRDDAFVPANLIRAARLRPGDLISGTLRPSRANDKFPGLAKIHTVNGLDPEQMRTRPKFSELTPIYPNEPLKMEHGRDSITGRAIDIVSPIGKGQRGLIVSPPKAGKTTVLKHICQSIAVNNPEVHLICLLVDERPEEVTDMERSIKGDVVASTFDMPADNHTRVSELVIERAKRIVEMGGDVVVVLDSITRLARAYNLAAPASGRILSGGVDSAALYPPKRFLGAARNIENGGSLTILASALVDTGSKMDEVIFEEFKGTGNMELKLDRDLADRRIFPAIDPVASGTRNEDLLIPENMRPFVWGIRRVLAGMNNTERAAASFIKGLKGTNSNEEFLIRTAKKAADYPEAM